MTRDERPTTGVFLVWDEEDVSVERRGAGTVHDRTVVTERRTVARHALWTNAVTDETIAAARRYAERVHDQYDNLRVAAYTGPGGNVRP